MSQAFKLYRLQQIDNQLDKQQAQLEEIRTALGDDQALRLAEDQARHDGDALHLAQMALRQAEAAVQSQRIKIETAEASLYGGKVRNPKELQDLQNEVAALKRYMAVLEDRQLDAMVAEEEAGSAGQASQVALILAKRSHDQKIRELTEEQNRILKDRPNLEIERRAAAGAIDAAEIALYENLRKQRRGVAVSLVKNKACTSCGSTLNANLLDASIVSGLLTRCEGCGRILYIG